MCQLQNKADPNVNLWPASNTTLKPAELEQEATMLRETLVTSLFTYEYVFRLLCAVANAVSVIQHCYIRSST
jgi:hypothetical protein